MLPRPGGVDRVRLFAMLPVPMRAHSGSASVPSGDRLIALQYQNKLTKNHEQ
jgi:hypothetical protein